MKTNARWVGATAGYSYPKRWAFKKDMPKLNPGQSAINLQFAFSCAYCVIDHWGRILMENGQWCPIWDFQLIGKGRVIGPRDFEAAKYTDLETEWRGAAQEMREDEFRASNRS